MTKLATAFIAATLALAAPAHAEQPLAQRLALIAAQLIGATAPIYTPLRLPDAQTSNRAIAPARAEPPLGREEKQRPAPAPTAIPNAARKSDIAGSGVVRSLPDDWFVYEKQFNRSAVRGLWDVSPPKNDWTIDDIERWNRENPEQAKAYQDRRWRAQFATLVLFEQNCAPRRFESVRGEMFTKWNALPEAERTEALNYEIEQIKRTKDYVLPETGEVFPGGFKWFCSVMNRKLSGGSYNDMIYPNAKRR